MGEPHSGLVPQLLLHDRGSLPVQLRGPFELSFYGDDDLFIFINGVLALDLGGVHQRLPGRVQVNDMGIASTIEGGSLAPPASSPLPGHRSDDHGGDDQPRRL